MSAVLNAPLPGGAWRATLPAFAAALAVLLLYAGSFAGMAAIWSGSQTFTHCFLVPPIAAWLVWRKRAALAALQPRAEPWLLLPLAATALAWLLGDLAGVNVVAQGAATALLVLLVPTLLGLQIARVLAFPLGFLFFMVPIGDFLLPTLMGWTADFTVFAVAASGVPVYREGLQFIIPTGAWSVVEACSGIRYLIASIMVGTLFAYLNYRSLHRRLLFCAASVLVPVLANWLRAYLIVMIGHLSGNELAVGVDHLIYGWVFFGIVIGAMFFAGARWAEPPDDAAAAAAAAPASADARGASPAAAAWLPAVLAALVLAAPQAALWRLDSGDAPAAPRISLPDLAGTADNTVVAAAPALQPISVGAAAEAGRVYAAPGGSVGVHVAYYRQQGYGRKLASSGNVLVLSDDKRWNQVANGRTALTVDGHELQLRSAELLNTAEQRATGTEARRLDVRQLYWVDGRFTASSQWASVLGLVGRLAGRGDDGALLVFHTEGPANETRPRLDAFIGRHLPALQARLQAVSRQR